MPKIFFICVFFSFIFFFCENVSKNDFSKNNVSKNDFFTENKIIENKIIEKVQIDTTIIDSLFEKIACKNIKNYINKNTKDTFFNAKKNPKIPFKIVCFGNSITRGFKVGSYQAVEKPYPKILLNLLKKDISQIEVLNEGHNGWRTDHALNNIQTKVLDKNPQIVLLEFGINDAYSNFSLALFEKNILNILKILQQKNIIPVLLTPTPITSKFKEQVEKYCEVLQKISKEQDISLINLQKEITQKAINEKISKKKLLPDDVHFGDEFYAWIGESVFLMVNDKY